MPKEIVVITNDWRERIAEDDPFTNSMCRTQYFTDYPTILVDGLCAAG